MNLSVAELESLLKFFGHQSFHQEFAAMLQDAQTKFDALNASLTANGASLTDLKTTSGEIKMTALAAENLLDGLVAKIGTATATDPAILDALDAAKTQVDALTAQNAALKTELQATKDELAAKVVADTPA